MRIGFLLLIMYRKYNLSEIDGNYIIPNTGLSWYGVPMVDQNINYNDDQMITSASSIYNYNSQETIIFESYWKFKKNLIKNNKIEYYLLNSTESVFSNYYNEDYYDDGSTGNVADVVFTTDEKVEFQTWNSNIQTSMINFNRVCGIQMKTVNVPSPIIDSYKDDFYNGNFYNGVFYGKWHDGKWGNGEFKGWNSATTITTSGSSQHLQSPIAINITNALNVTQFYENYNHLKKKDLYYDIAPWDDANKKKSEIISIKLPNKYRS